MSIESKIKELEEELAKTPRNKGTEHHIGKLKAKIAQLKEQLTTEKTIKKSGKSEHGYSVRKTGDATIVFVGFPSAGKSTLLNRITNAKSEVGYYEFTTLDVVPGVLEYKHAKIQVLDIPGIVEGASIGKGRGKEVLAVARIADLIVYVLDSKKAIEQKQKIDRELYNIGIRINQKKPDIEVIKKDRGGINLKSTTKQNLQKDTIKSILNEYGIHNAEVILREDFSMDRLIDAISKNRVYVPSLIVINKEDLLNDKEKDKLKEYFSEDDYIFISALNSTNLETLKEKVFTKLNLIRIYTKEPGKEPKLDKPLILKGENITIKDVAMKLHKEFYKDFLYAKIWGLSAKFPGQKKGIDHKLKDKDIVEIWVRK